MISTKYLILATASYAKPFDHLPGAAADGELFRETLLNYGVDSEDVVYVANPTWSQMLTAARAFSRMLSKACYGVVVYSGHSVEIDSENYLIPSDAVCVDDDRLVDLHGLERECIRLAFLLEYLQLSKVAGLLVLFDACRNNPFLDQFGSQSLLDKLKERAQAVTGFRASPFLAPRIEREPSPQTVVMFSTKRRAKAIDQLRADSVSPFCNAVLYGLVRNWPIDRLARHVRAAVELDTKGSQVPGVEGVTFDCVFVPNPLAEGIEHPSLPIDRKSVEREVKVDTEDQLEAANRAFQRALETKE